MSTQLERLATKDEKECFIMSISQDGMDQLMLLLMGSCHFTKLLSCFGPTSWKPAAMVHL